MLGYTENELRNLGITDVHPKESIDKVVSEFEAQARGEKTLAMEIPCLRKDGTVIYANINTSSTILEGKNCNIPRPFDGHSQDP